MGYPPQGAPGELSVLHYRRGGRFHSSPVCFPTVESFVHVADTLYSLAFFVPVSTRFDRIGTYIHVAAAGLCRLGVYGDDGSIYPGSLVLDAGTVDTGTTGDKEITVDLTLPPGLYWLTLLMNAGVTLAGIGRAAMLGPLGYATPWAAAANYYYIAHTFGSLPDSFPVGATMGQSGSVVSLRKA